MQFDSIDENYPYSEETYRIIKCALEVSHYFGSGFLESVYQRALEIELRDAGFSIESQKNIPVSYKGHDLGLPYRADIVVNDSIILELKAISKLTKSDEKQAVHYLKATGHSLALLLNFGNKSGLEWKRIINTYTKSSDEQMI